jgi:hypothetical protein
VYGQDVFNVSTPKQVYELFGEALAAYQSSGEVCAFSSKYDASTDKESNPHGYNSLGTKYVDYGLGANPNPAPDGTRISSASTISGTSPWTPQARRLLSTFARVRQPAIPRYSRPPRSSRTCRTLQE